MKIGVILPLGEDPTTHTIASYADIRGMALQAEEIGFDSVWVYDHLIYRFPDRDQFGIWEVWSILAGLAEATERVEIGTLVMCAAWRNPALLAKMAITADEVSGGRLILGLGAGWHEPEFTTFGYPFDHKVDRFEEALRIIVPLLREGKVDFHGKYFSAPNCEMLPPGPRPGKLPVLVASKGPRMLRLTAELADSWNTAWLGPADALPERREQLVAACREVGRDPSSVGVTVGLTIAFGEAAEKVPADRALSGSPAEIAAGLRAYADQGVEHVICACNPLTSDSYAQLGEALAIYRDSVVAGR